MRQPSPPARAATFCGPDSPCDDPPESYRSPSVRSRVPFNIAVAWLVAAGWAGLVWGLGSDALASPTTSRILGPLIEWLLPEWTPAEKWRLVGFVRKSAHVVEYAILAALVLRASLVSWRRSMALAAVFSLGLVTVMAIADETRQGRSAVRTGSAWDVALDVTGGALAVTLGLGLERLYRRRGGGRGDRRTANE